MSQFRTTADLLDDILTRSGETTNGNSQYEADALKYLNRVHHTVIAGGNEFNLDVDEPWLWARARRPITIELQPKVNAGTVALALGSEIGAFSSAPAASLAGWYLRIDSRQEIFRIATHSAGASAFELDAAYTETTGSALTFKAFKLDYELVPSYIVINEDNDKIDFEETDASELTATLTHGSYTPADLITEANTQLAAAGASAYAGTYSGATRKFSLISDLAGGGNTFKLLGVSGTNVLRSSLPTLGFDDLDIATAATHTSAYILGGISRLIEPFKIYRGNSFSTSSTFGNGSGNLTSIDINTMQKRRPLTTVVEGNPNKYAVYREDPDGKIFIRMNRYVEELTRVDIEYIPVPRDLQDNAVSLPKIPRKYSDLLEYGAASFIMIDKEDSKMSLFSDLAGKKLEAMLKANRNALQRTGENFGNVIARPDLMDSPRHLIYGEPLDQ